MRKLILWDVVMCKVPLQNARTGDPINVGDKFRLVDQIAVDSMNEHRDCVLWLYNDPPQDEERESQYISRPNSDLYLNNGHRPLYNNFNHLIPKTP